MKIIRPALAACSLSMASACAVLNDSQRAETSVCGWIQEPLVFALWSHMAGKPEPQRASYFPNAEAITYTTKDGRLLSGYKLRSAAAGGTVVGRMLVAQGNAMLSDRLLGSLNHFSEAGIEVYVFDYRGYGNSEGRRRLRAIVGDYREMADKLLASGDSRRFLYGISFGGIVLLNVIGSGAEYDRAVIDSTPSRLSDHGCPTTYDPVENIPHDASRMLLIAGEKDTVIPIRASEDLVSQARTHGARTEVRPDYAHPFMDQDEETFRSRLDLIKTYMLQ